MKQIPGQACGVLSDSVHVALILIGGDPRAEDPGHLWKPEAQKSRIQVHVTQAGKVELDVLLDLASPRRIEMDDVEAEALGHVFLWIRSYDGPKVGNALLDAAHVARTRLGKESTRTPSASLAPAPSPLKVDK